jgi:hypothetical protein
MEYFQKTNQPDGYFIESEYFTLLTYPDSKQELRETYFYHDLAEYLNNTNKHEEWQKDFLKKVEQYR